MHLCTTSPFFFFWLPLISFSFSIFIYIYTYVYVFIYVCTYLYSGRWVKEKKWYGEQIGEEKLYNIYKGVYIYICIYPVVGPAHVFFWGYKMERRVETKAIYVRFSPRSFAITVYIRSFVGYFSSFTTSSLPTHGRPSRPLHRRIYPLTPVKTCLGY